MIMSFISDVRSGSWYIFDPVSVRWMIARLNFEPAGTYFPSVSRYW